MKVKYRIKSRQVHSFFSFEESNTVDFTVQAKFQYIPFWLSVTKPFKTRTSAEEYIIRIKDEK